jgi:hypothetical protein
MNYKTTFGLIFIFFIIISPALAAKNKTMLLEDGEDQYGELAFKKLNISYTHLKPSDFIGTNLNDYNLIFIPAVPSKKQVDVLNSRKGALGNWIKNGGSIIVNAEWKDKVYRVTNPYSFLPVRFETSNSSDTRHDNISIKNISHLLMKNLTDKSLSGWGYSSHSEIIVVPKGARIISKTTNNYPHIVETCYGKGHIIVSSSDPEIHLFKGNEAAGQLILNEINFSRSKCGR